ncbi:MAG TPA: BTAD domain-containing putative transcriptional regulator [Solirubrobacteraceae bacterium]
MRPRLQNLLAGLIESNRLVVLSATAGAGKTTTAVDALGSVGVPVAWLTLDRTDALPGRLVTYLEAALGRVAPDVDGIAGKALAAGIPHPEAVGLLVEAVGERDLLLVLDELERLERSAPAWAAVEALFRYAPATMRLVVLSRQEIPADLCALPPTGEVAWLREDDLSFTVEEASEALTASGGERIDAAEAVAATGGWVTGVLFEAWRSAGHVSGMGGEVDPLHGYLSAHVLGSLTAEDREFLVATSLLDEVSAPRAEALGQSRAGERLVRLRAAHLPVTWHRDRLVMRCHSRFREYLLERLERRGAAATRDLHLAYGRLLVSEGHHEEATEELLRAGAAVEALRSAERVIGDVVERLDFPIAERWFEALGELTPRGPSPFTAAEIMLAAAREDYARGERVADELEAIGERGRLIRSSERVAAVMAWCYAGVGRLDEYSEVMREAPAGPTTEAVRYAVENLSVPAAPRPRPQPTGTSSDALLPFSDYLLGRLSELVEMPDSKWDQAIAGPWQIAALRASGQTRRALAMYEEKRRAGTASPTLRSVIGPEILIDAGRYEDARRELAQTREDARARSFWLWLENSFAELRLVLQVERDVPAARRLIDRLEPVARKTPIHAETLDTWDGLCLLLAGDHEAAAARLRRARDGMLAGQRLLYLPTAAVYLAEAEWQCGDEAAADRAADCALRAARGQGSNHLLLQALASFPAVVSRALDAETDAASAWHALGRALTAQGVVVEARLDVSLLLCEFGEATIWIDGEEIRPAINKSFELLAYLASRQAPVAQRKELLDALFAGRADDSARSYLRQAIRRLREALPDGDALIVEQGRVSLRDDLRIDSESARFQAQLAEAWRLQGTEKLTATLAALALVDKGEYLPDVRSAWADERRDELAEQARNARHDAAELAFVAGLYQDARRLQTEVLRSDPYREVGWRLTMRIASALGDDDGVIRAYRDCAKALAELGTEPGPATRALLEQMRR